MISAPEQHSSNESIQSSVERVDLEPLDESMLEFDKASISAINPQRFEMNMLSGVVAFRPTEGLIVGVKYVAKNEFWTRCYGPSNSLLPSVFMVEAMGQLCSFYWQKTHPTDGRTFVLGGVEVAKFHAPVAIGDKLILAAKAVDLKPRKATFQTAGFVAEQRVFEARIVGMGLKSSK